MQRVDLSQYYTRSQTRSLFTQRPQAAPPPTVLTISGTGVVITTTEQYSYVDVTLTDPATPAWANTPEYVQGYAFKVTFTQLGVQVERDFFLPFGGPYRLQPIPPGAAVTITARTIDYLGQISVDSASVSGPAASDTVPPAAPTISGAAVVAGAQINLTALNTESDFDHYELWRVEKASLPLVTDPGWTLIFSFIGTSVTDHAIPTTAADYYYKVVVKDVSGNAATSNITGPLSLVTTGLNPPAQVDFTGATATANADGTITLFFLANTESSLASYRIWRRVHGPITWTLLDTLTASPGAPGSHITYIDFQAENGVTYDYVVTAVNNVGDESALPTSFLTATAADTTAPAPPTTPTATGRQGGVDIVWNPSISGDVVGYQVTFRLNNGSAFSAPVQVDGNRYTLYGLSTPRETLANQLEFNIYAVDDANNISTPADLVVDFPSLIGYQPADSTIPNAPVTLSSTINDDGTIDLSWTAPNLADIAGYQVEQFDSLSADWKILATIQDPTPGTKKYKAVGLEPFSFRSRQYRFRVRTLDFSGNISPVNLIDNPGFEDGTTSGWVLAGGAPTIVAAPTHNASTKAAKVSFNTRLRFDGLVTAGNHYTFSAFVAEDVAVGNAFLRVAWYQADGVTVVSQEPDVSIAVNTNFQRLALHAVAPVGAAQVKAYLLGDPNNVAQTFIYDDAQFEQSLIETTYADGKTALLSAIDTTGPADYATIGLSATGQLGQITIKWTNPTTGTAGNFDYINGVFEVWRATNAAFTTGVTKIAEVPAHNDGASNSYVDLSPDETVASTFWYRLKARDRFANESGYLNGGVAVTATSLTTNDINILRKDGLFPSVPVMTSATANNDGTITVVFASANTSGRNDLAGYNIYRRRGADPFQIVGNIRTNVETGSQTFIDQTVDLSTLVGYDYKATAYDTQGEESAQSAASVSATPIDNRTPAAPTNVTVKGSIGQIIISWTASTSFGVSQYQVTIPDIAGQGIITVNVTGTEGSIRMAGGPSGSALQVPAFYTAIAVKAYSRSGGALSAAASPAAAPDVQSYIPIDTIPPDTPAGIPTLSNNQLGAVTLSWTASLATDVAFYTVEFTQETGFNNNTEGAWIFYGQVFAPTTSCRIMGLEPSVITGLRYKFRVRAFDHANNGSAAFSITAFTSVLDDTTAPATPTGFQATGTNDGGSTTLAVVTCSWTLNTERDIFAYELAVDKTDGSSFQVFTIPPTSASYAVRGLLVGVAYRFRLRAVDTSRNRSDYTAISTVTVAAPPPTNTAPGAPTISLSQVQGASSTTVTVTISCGTGGSENDLNHHSVRRDTANDEGPEVGQVAVTANAAVGSQTTFTDVRPRASTAVTYWYAARTLDNSGLVSPVSNIASTIVNGTGSDPGSDPNCYTMDMFLGPGFQVRDAKVGDLVTVLEDGELIAYPILRTRRAVEPCVRLTTENGCVMELSNETSMHIPDGTGDTFAKLMQGRPTMTLVDGSLAPSVVCKVEDIGPQEVMYIDLGGRIFAGGADQNRLGFSHNFIVLGGK